jgi:hypothetical protein
VNVKNARVKFSWTEAWPLNSTLPLFVLCRVLGNFGIASLAARSLPGYFHLA